MTAELSPRSRAYKVGRGKPPVHTRFQPGQSGNPRGRPKGSKSLNTMIEAELDEQVTIQENGRPRTLTKRQLIVKQVTNKAAAGDVRFILMLLKQEAAASSRADGDAPDTSPASEDDLQILAKWKRQLAGGGSDER